jgi:predicted DCC family thiol-disulfide oxidoreductase YuxK
MPQLAGKTLVLYDGVCGLCNRLVRVLLRFDKDDCFRYAPLQSQFASEVLRRHGLDAAELDTVTLIGDYGTVTEQAYTKSDAIMLAAHKLGGIWLLGRVTSVLPKSIRDKVYDVIARNRYRIFGKYRTCPVPKPEERAKFVE